MQHIRRRGQYDSYEPAVGDSSAYRMGSGVHDGFEVDGSFASTFAMCWSTVTLNRDGQLLQLRIHLRDALVNRERLARHVGRRLLSSSSQKRLSSAGEGHELRLAADGENHRA